MTRVEVHPPLQITTIGPVFGADIDVTARVIAPTPDRPVLGVFLRLTHATNPAAEQPAVAQITSMLPPAEAASPTAATTAATHRSAQQPMGAGEGRGRACSSPIAARPDVGSPKS